MARSLPFQRTTEPGMKSLPVTVSENAEAPSVTDDGLIAANTGAGLLPLPRLLAVKLS